MNEFTTKILDTPNSAGNTIRMIANYLEIDMRKPLQYYVEPMIEICNKAVALKEKSEFTNADIIRLERELTALDLPCSVYLVLYDLDHMHHDYNPSNLYDLASSVLAEYDAYYPNGVLDYNSYISEYNRLREVFSDDNSSNS